MAVSASRHRRPVPRGQGGGSDIRHMTVADHKKLSMSGFLRWFSPNGPGPNLGTLRAMCHLLRSCWAETTPLNKRTHNTKECKHIGRHDEKVHEEKVSKPPRLV